MKGFRSVGADQRFLAAFSGISPHFRPRRHLMTASHYRTENDHALRDLGPDHRNCQPTCSNLSGRHHHAQTRPEPDHPPQGPTQPDNARGTTEHTAAQISVTDTLLGETVSL